MTIKALRPYAVKILKFRLKKYGKDIGLELKGASED